jgi:hypothetical protein
MYKLGYILNILTLAIGTVSMWQIFSQQAENEFLKQEISDFNSKVQDITLAADEAKKGQSDKFAREKRKNEELEENEKSSVGEIADLSRKQREMNIILEENTKKVEELSSSIQKAKLRLVGIDTEIERSRGTLRSMTLLIPNLQSSLVSLQDEISQKKNRIIELEKKILSYDRETDLLKQHFELTVSALQKDFYEHPWLERGERVVVSFSSLDLETGMIMLPIGKNHGLEQSMRFAVRGNGKSICQIKINKVAFDHCIAMIIPLLGNPKELLEVTNLDLIYL